MSNHEGEKSGTEDIHGIEGASAASKPDIGAVETESLIVLRASDHHYKGSYFFVAEIVESDSEAQASVDGIPLVGFASKPRQDGFYYQNILSKWATETVKIEGVEVLPLKEAEILSVLASSDEPLVEKVQVTQSGKEASEHTPDFIDGFSEAFLQAEIVALTQYVDEVNEKVESFLASQT